MPATFRKTRSGEPHPPSDIAPAGARWRLLRQLPAHEGHLHRLAINAPFGLTTKPSNYNYQGAVIAQTTKLTTYNFNPTVAVRVAPGITIGVGAQIETADGTLRFATGAPSGPTTTVDGNGWGFGATAGIMIEASPTTQIGVGYRSQMDQDINGRISTAGTPYSQATAVTLNLPDVVTASIRQVVSPVMRLNGTFEWTNWSRFKNLAVTTTESGASVLGACARRNHDRSIAVQLERWLFHLRRRRVRHLPDAHRPRRRRLRVVADHGTRERSTGIPDANRVWLSGGFSWAFTRTTTIDFAASHLFVDDGAFNRTSLAGVNVQGEAQSSINIVSIGIKTHW